MTMRRQNNMILWERHPETTGLDTGKLDKANKTEVLPILITIGISLLFVFSALKSLKSVFPILTMPPEAIWLIVLVVVGMLCWNGIQEADGLLVRRQIGNLVMILGGAILFYSFYRRYQLDLEDGLLAIAHTYIAKWNSYFQTNVFVPGGVENQIPMAYGFAVLIAVSVVLMLACLWRRLWIMGLLSAGAIALDLLVGYAPQWDALVLLFIAVVFCFSGTWRKAGNQRQTLALAILVVAVVAIVPAAGMSPAKSISEQEDQMLAFQKELELAIKNISFGEVSFQNGAVDNHRLNYTGKEVMKLAMDQETLDNVYLRGYYGSHYVNGSWIQDDGAFLEECDNYGMAGDTASRMLCDISYYNASSGGSYSSMMGNAEQVTYTLEYTNIRDDYAYMPYFADLSTLEQKVEVSADYDIRKERSLSSLTVGGTIENTYQPDSVSSVRYIGMGDIDEEFLYWYNDFVQENYLDVPTEQYTAKSIAYQMAESEDYRTMVRQLNSDSDYIRNSARAGLAYGVRMNFSNTCTYSQILDPISGDTDPIEYFLKESHKGYCVHFASAGVFVLRELGVPARYCTGYVAKTTENKKEPSGDYVNSVKDSNAHAWVEIYLDDIGWVPMEMTPGDGTVSSNPEQQTFTGDHSVDHSTPENDQAQTGDQEDLVPTDDEQQNSDTPQSQESASTENTSTENGLSDQSQGHGTGTPGTDGSKDGWGFAGGGGFKVFGQNGSLRMEGVLLVAGIVTVILVILHLIRKRKRNRHEKLARMINSQRYQSVINTLNHQLYRKTVRLLKRRVGQLSDQQYQEILMKAYPQVLRHQWDHYMEVVRKAAFSDDEFAMEEMQFVYSVYKKCRNVKEI